ncbi:hypothetical protein P9239_19315 [Caballeronia sp. LZ062]|uniref:hypothetical protein n=1 Tax=unclassified Caballeronia TaxID=2646786 RepID=UPI00286020DE|nr:MULTISPECIES: hypothetical protein [unclassified Caballeronia]MDR5855711.1 hypothetical protein [Caballeronia sp. LZ050]MDR5872502.1 hypothetical protein [Caballeronia sp. LZ062]
MTYRLVAKQRVQMASIFLLQARSLLRPLSCAVTPVACALNSRDRILLSCCAIATHIGVKLGPLDYENVDAVHACLRGVRVSLDDIDRVQALFEWCQPNALPDEPPCPNSDLWTISNRIYQRALNMCLQTVKVQASTKKCADEARPASSISPATNQGDDDELDSPIVMVDIFQGSVNESLASIRSEQ